MTWMFRSALQQLNAGFTESNLAYNGASSQKDRALGLLKQEYRFQAFARSVTVRGRSFNLFVAMEPLIRKRRDCLQNPVNVLTL